MGPVSVMIVNDPEIVNELYITKNRLVDKSEKLARVIRLFFRDSILFSPSNEIWSLRRKHLSAAFYKDKLKSMLEMIIAITHSKI
jgi:cytochrome P450